MEFDHIGIFVRDIADAREKLTVLLPMQRWSAVFEDPLLQVRVQFGYEASRICYELVAPFGPRNPVDVVLKTRKNVLNHVAYRVADLDRCAEDLCAKGAFRIGPARPAIAFGGRRVIFLVTTLDFVIELVETPAPVPA